MDKDICGHIDRGKFVVSLACSYGSIIGKFFHTVGGEGVKKEGRWVVSLF